MKNCFKWKGKILEPTLSNLLVKLLNCYGLVYENKNQRDLGTVKIYSMAWGNGWSGKKLPSKLKALILSLCVCVCVCVYGYVHTE
jgi:hypothetical protein